jgi:hypothetical protein
MGAGAVRAPSSAYGTAGGAAGDVYNITIDASRMPSADFEGLLESIEQAKRMKG